MANPINRDRILGAAGVGLAAAPTVLIPGVPWYVGVISALGAFLSALARPEKIRSAKKDDSEG